MTAGRKRTFDTDTALDQAMRVFWDNGYAGTSITDLTEALGINKPSLYAAFGNKESLFKAALQHYADQYGAPLLERLTSPEDAPLRVRLEAYLTGIADLVSDRQNPKGCLLVKTSCESGGQGFPNDVADSVQAIGLATERVLQDVLSSEQRRGNLPDSLDTRVLASYLLSAMYGLSVMARRGKPRKDLKAIVDVIVSGFPAGVA